MKLVSFLSVLLTALVPCMSASGQAAKPAARAVKNSKPNVIFILVDDMGWGEDVYKRQILRLRFFRTFLAWLTAMECSHVYKACKEELTKPREERRNCVKAIYEGLTDAEISREIKMCIRDRCPPPLQASRGRTRGEHGTQQGLRQKGSL